MSNIFGEITRNFFFSPSESDSVGFRRQPASRPLVIEQLHDLVASAEHGISGSEFCRRYLGTDRNYLSVCRHRRTDLSARLVLRLSRNLLQRSDTWAAIKSVDPRVRARCSAKSLTYRKLAELALGALSQLGAATH
jgi:hypothetical protein